MKIQFLIPNLPNTLTSVYGTVVFCTNNNVSQIFLAPEAQYSISKRPQKCPDRGETFDCLIPTSESFDWLIPTSETFDWLRSIWLIWITSTGMSVIKFLCKIILSLYIMYKYIFLLFFYWCFIFVVVCFLMMLTILFRCLFDFGFNFGV